LSFNFEKEEYNRPILAFSEMETSTNLGLATHLVHLGTMTPNDRVTFSVSSDVIVVRVEVLDSDGKRLYDAQERNGTIYGDIRLYHTSDVTLRITDLCSPCKYTGQEHVYYTEYSLSPHFEVLVFSIGLWATVVLFAFGNWLVVTGRLCVKRGWLLLVSVPVTLATYSYYLWAFRDPSSNNFGAATGVAISVAAFLLALERRSQHTAESSVSAAQIADSAMIVGEAEAGRREDAIERIERKLETLYSPLYEILRRARFETNDFKAMVIAEWSRKEGHVGPRDCVLSEEELTRVREIVERHGHYMDPVEQAKLTKVLSDPDSIGAISGERLKQPWHLFWNAEIDPRFDYIKKTRDALIRELSDLTGSHDGRVGGALHERSVPSAKLEKVPPNFEAEILERKISYDKGDPVLFRAKFIGELKDGGFTAKVEAPDGTIHWWADNLMKRALNGSGFHERKWSHEIPQDFPVGKSMAAIQVYGVITEAPPDPIEDFFVVVSSESEAKAGSNEHADSFKEEVWNAFQKWAQLPIVRFREQEDTLPLAEKPPELAFEIEECLKSNYSRIWNDLQKLRQRYHAWKSENVSERFTESVNGVPTVHLDYILSYNRSMCERLLRSHTQLAAQIKSEILDKHYTRLKC
jgi:hypothetical protein